ncbi:hypothetical protein N7G274_009500 [Stereocaulon virgatum]|uniref:Uncharacterized protein n=1 Tax=Stereocaulon virgatum TaxID=373712 RepID=A0ABR3ZW00_9LECA
METDFTTASNQRLATYLCWPHNHPSAIDMAAAGFYSTCNTQKQDSVDCRECGLKLNDWHPRDNPLFEHARRKPDCPFIIRNLGSALVSRLKADISVQRVALQAPPLKPITINECPSKPAEKKYPKSRLRQTEVAAPKSNPQAFDTWLRGARARFLEIFDEAREAPSHPYHDLDLIDPKDTLSVRCGDNDDLHQALSYMFKKYGPLHPHRGGRDMVGTTWISCSRPGNMGVPAALICVPKNGPADQSSNTKVVCPSSIECDRPDDCKKVAKSPRKSENGEKEAKQMCEVELALGDEDWETVDGLGEDEWTNVGKDELA